MLKKNWKLLVCLTIPIFITLSPVPDGLEKVAWNLFALYIGAVLALVLQPYEDAVVFYAVIAFGGIVLNQFNAMISGYSFPMVWLVFSAFLIGTAFVVTGLGKRIAYWLIGTVGNTPLRLGYAACLTDLATSPATPSNGARTGGITYPIFKSVAIALGSEPGPTANRIGAFLTMTTFFACGATSCVFMTAVATMPFTLEMGSKILGVGPISWIDYFKISVVPGIAMLIVAPVIPYILCKPEIKHIDNKAIAKEGINTLGKMKTEEKLLAVFFVLAILAWATGGYFNPKIDSNAVAVAFVACLLLFRVISWNDVLNAKGAWSLFIWYGGIVGIIGALTKAKFFDWLGVFLSKYINLTGMSDIGLIAAMSIMVIVGRYFFASGIVFCASLLPIIFTIGKLAGVSSIPALYLVAYASAYAGCVTHYSGTVSPILFAAGYVDLPKWWKVSIMTMFLFLFVALGTSWVYWQILGIW